MGRARKGQGDADSGLFERASFAFTESRLEAAKRAVLEGAVPTDESGRRSWRDADCRGLAVVVNEKTGSSVYYFIGKVNGQTSRRAIGPTDTVRLQESRQRPGPPARRGGRRRARRHDARIEGRPGCDAGRSRDGAVDARQSVQEAHR
jgi:hypothetical protein